MNRYRVRYDISTNGWSWKWKLWEQIHFYKNGELTTEWICIGQATNEQFLLDMLARRIRKEIVDERVQTVCNG